MGMPHVVEHWTREKVWALPEDGQRRELIDGELVVTPAPAYLHQRAVSDLAYLLRHALTLAPGSTARLLTSPADLTLGEDEILQPDLFIYQAPADRQVGGWKDIRTLMLVVEVLSPSTARYDRGLKRLRYQRARVPEYWIVDLDGRVVERWRPDDARPEILNTRLQWSSGDGAAVEIDLEEFFREVAGE